jgi:hypothetical protein
MQWHCLIVKIVAKWWCHINWFGWMKTSCKSHLHMEIPLWLSAMYCLLWLKFYVIYLMQLGPIAIACGNYNLKLIVNLVIDL